MVNKLINTSFLRKSFIIIIISSTLFNSCSYNDTYSNLQIHFIYVGEGDSILIKKNNIITLADAGPSVNSKELVKYLKKEHISKINNLILTHPHEDHFGGMNDILTEFKVDNFFSPKVTVDNEDYKYLLYNLKRHDLNISIIKKGMSLNLGKNCNGEFLAPSKDYYDNLNNYSAVLRLCYLNSTFILCGDSEKEEESEILSNYDNIKSDVIKIGHHGSKTATSDDFLKSVSPYIAIISAGVRNKFDHPHEETLNKLNKSNISLYRTDINKTIILSSDGTKIYVSTETKN